MRNSTYVKIGRSTASGQSTNFIPKQHWISGHSHCSPLRQIAHLCFCAYVCVRIAKRLSPKEMFIFPLTKLSRNHVQDMSGNTVPLITWKRIDHNIQGLCKYYHQLRETQTVLHIGVVVWALTSCSGFVSPAVHNNIAIIIVDQKAAYKMTVSWAFSTI